MPSGHGGEHRKPETMSDLDHTVSLGPGPECQICTKTLGSTQAVIDHARSHGYTVDEPSMIERHESTSEGRIAMRRARIEQRRAHDNEVIVKALRDLANKAREDTDGRLTEAWWLDRAVADWIDDEAEALELRTPEEWIAHLRLGKVLDPDGWRGPDSPEWATPISHAEFSARYARSTVDSRPQ